MTTSQLVETTLCSDSLWTFSHPVPLPGMPFLFLSIYFHITTKVCIYKHAFNLSKCCLSTSLTHSRCFVMLAIYFFHMVLSSFVQRLYPVSAVPYSIKHGPLWNSHSSVCWLTDSWWSCVFHDASHWHGSLTDFISGNYGGHCAWRLNYCNLRFYF